MMGNNKATNHPIEGAGIFRTKLPKKFLAGGINCGVRRYRPDLGIILSELPCVASAVYTRNSYQSAHIQYCKNILPSKNIRAIITNSGQANAATGEEGKENNQHVVTRLARELGCKEDAILIASTGVIGQQLAIDKILAAVPELVHSVSNIAENFATAILTTDLVPKTVYKMLELSSGTIHITGICKGSGMIHPNMATMLGYLLCDVVLTPDQSHDILSHACRLSFNMISVDGETSTNDTVFFLANGASGVSIKNKSDFNLLQDALTELSIMLAKSIVRDGEGATKLFEVTIKGMNNRETAESIARSLITSPLIKTAIHGASPNWGRILSRLGSEAIPISIIEKCSIYIQDILVFSNNASVIKSASTLEEAMKEDTITLTIDFFTGKEEARAWGCDLSKKYITINAGYLT